MIDKIKFLGGSGARLTKQLFYEYRHVSDNDFAIYTLARTDKEIDGKVYPSLYRLYMEEEDITEAKFVEKYLYDWEQWERIANGPVFKEEIELWRKELRVKVGGQLVDRLIKDAFNKTSKSSMSSAKYLLDNVIKTDNKRTSRGRPSSKTDNGPIDISTEVASDLERVRKLRSNGQE